MNNQEIYNFIANFLLIQKEPAHIHFSPKLRDNHNRKCAIGCLFTDDQITEIYASEQAVKAEYSFTEKAENLLVNKGYDRNLLVALRIAHDYPIIEENWMNSWKIRMINIAKKYNLNCDVVSQAE